MNRLPERTESVSRRRPSAVRWPHSGRTEIKRRIYVKCYTCGWRTARREERVGECPKCGDAASQVKAWEYPLVRKRRTWEVKNHALYQSVVGRGIRLSEFADKLGVSLRMVERYVFAGSRPKPEVRKKAAQLLGIDESELWKG